MPTTRRSSRRSSEEVIKTINGPVKEVVTKVSAKTPEAKTIKVEKKDRKEKKITMTTDLEKAIAGLKKSDERCKKLSVPELKNFEKTLKKTFDKTKRETQLFEQERAAAKPSRNRSGKKRGSKQIVNQQKGVYSEGKWILRGMDEARDKFDQDEMEYLQKNVSKTKIVGDLKTEHLRYLVAHIYIDELKAIRSGEIESFFHSKWEQLKGKCQHELQSEIRTTLFTNEQRDYISGMLQELFDANKKDDDGDIRHKDINYVNVVMLPEATIRIVKHVHNFASTDEAMEYMRKSSREAHGISSDEE